VCLAWLSGDGIILCDLSLIMLCDTPEPHGARGDICAGNLSTTSGAICSGSRSKASHTSIVDLCNDML
jgi:hypothetical protein